MSVVLNRLQADRLYLLYQAYAAELRRESARVNASLGDKEPEKATLRVLSRADFESILVKPAADYKAKALLIRQIIRGHEHEFPELCELSSSTHRKTGT